jgi:hypothetical protein
MTDRMRSPPYTFSLSLNDQTFFEVDLLFLVFVALVITHFILVTFGFGDICKCSLFKPFDGFAALDNYFELPQSLDYNYKRKNGIKNGINETDDNGKKYLLNAPRSPQILHLVTLVVLPSYAQSVRTDSRPKVHLYPKPAPLPRYSYLVLSISRSPSRLPARTLSSSPTPKPLLPLLPMILNSM